MKQFSELKENPLFPGWYSKQPIEESDDFTPNMDYAPVTFSSRYIKQYWLGSGNRFIRYFSYLRSGFALFNEAKNYIFAAIGAVFTAKAIVIFGIAIDPSWVIIASILGLPVLLLIGRWNLFRANKAQQYITTQHGSITQWQSHNMQVIQTAMMKAIAKKMGVDVEDLEKSLMKDL